MRRGGYLSPGVNGFIDDLFTGGFSEVLTDECGRKASASMQGVDANIRDVEDNWHTTGFYTPDQMDNVNQFAMDVIAKAGNGIRAALAQLQLPMHRDLLTKALEEIQADRVSPLPYVQGVNGARSVGFQIIESQGYKRWIVRVLRASRDAQLAMEIVECARPGILNAIQVLANAFDLLVRTVKAIASVAKEIVKQAGAAIAKIPDILGSFLTVLKIMPWILLVGGGYYVAVKTEILPAKYDPLKLRERETWKPWRRIGE